MTGRERIAAREYTYCQAFYTDPYAVRYFLVATPHKREAMERADAYAIARWGLPKRIQLYPRNYTHEARKLLTLGLHDFDLIWTRGQYT